MDNASLETSQQMAGEWVRQHTDPNEIAKSLRYLREHGDGAQFFRYLNAVTRDGRAVMRSGRTLDHYREIRSVCDKYLKPYQNDPDQMAQILGWAVRLMRYYAVEPTLPQPWRDDSKPDHPPEMEFAHPRRIQDVDVGTLLKGKITRLQPYGAFVDVGVGRDGLVHISEIADRRVGSVAEVVQVGDEVVVKVISVDLSKNRIGLSMKGIAQ